MQRSPPRSLPSKLLPGSLTVRVTPQSPAVAPVPGQPMQETNAHLSEETSLRDMAAVHGLLLRMAQCHDLDQLFALVTDHLGRLHDTALCRIWLMEQADPQRCAACRHFYDCPEHRRCLRLAAGYGQSRVSGETWTALDGRHQRFPLGRGKVGLIAASGEAFHVDAVSPDMPWVSDPDWIAREGISTFLGQPLTHKGEVLGVLALFSRSRHDGLALDRLRLIADYLAVSLANAQQFEELTRLKRRLEIENSYLQRDSADPGPFLVGDSQAIRGLKENIRRVAFSAAPVLITGEMGTGKGAVAAELHRQSAVAAGPLVKVDCAAISPGQFEREFLGERQDDAVHVGFLEAAAHGTLFLENVDDIPLDVQGKLLGIIHSGSFLRPGDKARRPVRIRILAATHADLFQQVRQGKFREDLYYQLNVLALDVPPLRERKEDIPLLAGHFLSAFAAQLHRPASALPTDVLPVLTAYDWPGNVRELRNILLRAVITAPDGRLDAGQLAASLRACAPPPDRAERVYTETEMDSLFRDNLVRALDQCGRKIYGPDGAAALLGISPTTLCSRLKKYGISRRDGRPENGRHART